ncbi:polysaccharide biosynthesis/export family protein [Mucilaginibacter ginsenosidivorax]|uniref:Uncharacterized protein n=1 Tax=Mucilaginibacter ginsenosidivorax TaxID=862126 RepID=A0A5B8W1Z9_9SPHI|nr:polysaccharide biosynthesis/export family protein [Mucilaginibacter ginsenosidivorax]QEC78070.1 hypothetical protein FSB76_19815 [Mucilaginibacter ginsenosidivorax]
MRKTYFLNSYLILVILFVSVGLFSCSSAKNIKYFKDIPDSGQLKTIAKAEYTEPTIQGDDILTIIIETVDPAASISVNQGNVPIANSAISTGGATSFNQQASAGYLVDKEGYVTIPILGKLTAMGYTTAQLRDTIQKKAAGYFKNYTVIVRFANFKVSVTGEVARPGQYIVPNEKVNILDAIAMAGDLTIFGKRENVLLIRENPDGSKTPYRVNLNKSNIMSAPYYYLRQNDIIYVEPTKGKAEANDAYQTRVAAIATSVLSLLIIIATRIK